MPFLKSEIGWFILIISVFAIAFSVFITYVTNRITKVRTKSSEELITMLKNKEQSDFEKNVGRAITNLPEGLSADKYFSKLKDTLSDISFMNLKIADDGSIDREIEELINNHHKQAINQAAVQFWFSLFASIIGFAFIIYMIVSSSNAEWFEYILNVFPGVIFEAVSLLFFSQSKETRERASDFLNRLREDRLLTKSIIVADSISDESVKANIKAKIALHMSGIADTSISTNGANFKQNG